MSCRVMLFRFLSCRDVSCCVVSCCVVSCCVVSFLVTQTLYPCYAAMIKHVFIQQTFEEMCISTYPYANFASSPTGIDNYGNLSALQNNTTLGFSSPVHGLSVRTAILFFFKYTEF